jgi:hypothetical protein
VAGGLRVSANPLEEHGAWIVPGSFVHGPLEHHHVSSLYVALTGRLVTCHFDCLSVSMQLLLSTCCLFLC